MAKRRIDPRIEIGAVKLQVADLDRALAFYRDVLGFEITQRVGRSTAFLSAAGYHPHIVVTSRDGRPATVGAGSRDFAIRYPDRDGLADAWRRISEAAVSLDRATDDGVSEALHLKDPDGNRVELYYDRRPEEWPREADGSVRLVVQPLDLDSLKAAAQERTERETPVPQPEPAPPLSDSTRGRLAEMRTRLLNLHKVLLDDTKAAYEMDRGRVGSNASLLQLVINDPWFAWLHPLSELVVRIDETLQTDAPATEADGAVLLAEVERLLSPVQGTAEFAKRYYEALQRQPAVIVAHAEVRRILKQAK